MEMETPIKMGLIAISDLYLRFYNENPEVQQCVIGNPSLGE